MFSRLLRFVLIVMLAFSAPAMTGAFAQGVGQAPSGLIADQQKVLKDLVDKTNDLEKQIQENAKSDGKLVDIRLQLEDLSQKALTAALAF
jgi:potassium-dependent mechanosensitive channel